MFYTTEAIASDPSLAASIDLVEEGDFVSVDIPGRCLEIVGIQGVIQSKEEIHRILEQRKQKWKPRDGKYRSGVLRLFADRANSPMEGGYMR